MAKEYPHSDRLDWELTRDELFQKYAQLMHHIAARWKCQFPRAEYADLYAETVRGFVEAYARYDRSRKLKFATYAKWWALWCLRTYVGNTQSRGIHVPDYIGVRSFRHQSTDSVEISDHRAAASTLDERPTPDEFWRLVLSVIPSRRDREIVRLRFRDGLPQRTIAAMMGISPQATSQALKRALRSIGNRLPSLRQDVA